MISTQELDNFLDAAVNEPGGEGNPAVGLVDYLEEKGFSNFANEIRTHFLSPGIHIVGHCYLRKRDANKTHKYPSHREIIARKLNRKCDKPIFRKAYVLERGSETKVPLIQVIDEIVLSFITSEATTHNFLDKYRPRIDGNPILRLDSWKQRR